MDRNYISTTETAKLIRKALKTAFPAVKFKVRSDKYAGGSSINVRWTDGPTAKQVESVAKQYQGGGFDGMIDMKYHIDHWLLPDGSTVCAHSPGTTDSAGLVPPVREWMPHPDAKLVSFSPDFVFCNRDYSPEFMRRRLDRVRARYRDVDLSSVEIAASDFDGHAFIKSGGRIVLEANRGGYGDLYTILYQQCQETAVFA